jgi:hypothetical protein
VKATLIVLAILGVLLACTQITLFVVQPIGAVPEAELC